MHQGLCAPPVKADAGLATPAFVEFDEVPTLGSCQAGLPCELCCFYVPPHFLGEGVAEFLKLVIFQPFFFLSSKILISD